MESTSGDTFAKLTFDITEMEPDRKRV